MENPNFDMWPQLLQAAVAWRLHAVYSGCGMDVLQASAAGAAQCAPAHAIAQLRE